MIHTATVAIYFDIKQFEDVLFAMAFILGNINNRAVLIHGDNYFDIESASNGAVSSNPMHAITQLAELHALSAQLNTLTPTGNLAGVTVGPPIPQPKNCFAVGLNYKDQRDAALAWLKQFGDPYALSVMDGGGRVGMDYGVYGVPETFVIDKAGVIRYKQIGPVTPKALSEKILPLVRKLQSS